MEFLDYFSRNQHAKLYIKLLKHPMQLFVSHSVIIQLYIENNHIFVVFSFLFYIHTVSLNLLNLSLFICLNISTGGSRQQFGLDYE